MIRPFSPEKTLNLSSIGLGATQTVYLGLFPAMATATGSPLSWIMTIYGIGILVFLASTGYWGKNTIRLGFKQTLNYGLWGLLLSQVLTFALLAGAGGSNLFFFILSRLVYALTASAIIPLSQAFRLQGIRDHQEKKLLDHSIALNLGRIGGLVLAIIFHSHLPAVFLLLALFCLMTLILNFFCPYPKAETAPSDLPSPDLAGAGGWAGKLFLFPLLFSTITGSYHAGPSQAITRLVAEPSRQTLFLSLVLLVGSILILLIQMVLKRTNLFQNARALSYGGLFLVFASLVFFQLDSFFQLGLFVFLSSVGASLIPISYAREIHLLLNDDTNGPELSSRISFHQTLGSSLGFILTGPFIGKGAGAPGIVFLLSLAFLALVLAFYKTRKDVTL